ncbi:MAG: hypothetical protein JO249_04675 [Acidobacteria bacterium]|nr:hypothetical protein [Acidobacteriota bacterium]
MREALYIAAVLVASGAGISAQTRNTEPAATEAPPSSLFSDDQKTPVKETNDHNWHLRLGTVTAGYFQGPGFYPYYPFYLMAPWDPFWGMYYPAYAPNVAYSSGKGEVKLTAATKEAKVFVDGAYAGNAGRLKHIWLDPGAYDLAVAIPGRAIFEQRIYVLSGKTLKITARGVSNTLEKEEP